jgi:hypothetical protein
MSSPSTSTIQCTRSVALVPPHRRAAGLACGVMLRTSNRQKRKQPQLRQRTRRLTDLPLSKSPSSQQTRQLKSQQHPRSSKEKKHHRQSRQVGLSGRELKEKTRVRHPMAHSDRSENLLSQTRPRNLILKLRNSTSSASKKQSRPSSVYPPSTTVAAHPSHQPASLKSL